MVNERVWNAVLGCNLKNDRMISVRFQGKSFNITVIQVCALTSNAEEAEVEQFYDDLQDLLELTPKKDVLFILGDWNATAGSQETPGVTGKFGFGLQSEAGQRLIEFCQNALVIANTLFQQHKRRLYTWTPFLRACSSSCLLSQWCHPAISSSVLPYTFCLQSFQDKSLFWWVNFGHQVGKILELQHQSFQWLFRIGFL